MNIQWFPGHMTKTLRQMKEDIKCVDCIVYILDSRAVAASFNPEFLSFVKDKPVLYILNKADMVEREDIDAWRTRLENEGKSVVISQGNSKKDVAGIIEKLKILNKSKIEKFKNKGVNATVRGMVIGIPNSGKSTVINSLCGGKKTKTGNKAGVTRGRQWVRISENLDLMDTPGTLSPRFENKTLACHTALIGSINDVILDSEELAFELVAFLSERYLQKFCQYYKITKEQIFEHGQTPADLIKIACINRNCLKKGGECDYERISKALIDDFRNRRIGKLMLEKADDVFDS